MFTNAAAQSALSALTSITDQIARTTEVVSTGRKINSAQDSTAYWSIAARMESDVSTFSTIVDGLNNAKSRFTVTDAALGTVYNSLTEIQTVLVAAQAPGADRAVLQNQITGYITDINSAIASASVDGNNFLAVDSGAATYNANASYVSNVSSAGAISTMNIGVANYALTDADAGTDGILEADITVDAATQTILTIDISGLDDSATDLAFITNITSAVSTAMDSVLTAQSNIGVALNRFDSGISFVEALSSAKENAVATLVNADLEEEAANLSALQSQQQLAIQALAIANSQYSNVLRLFA
ncbi:MAG: flagellin [Pseudomonadota bacterium]